MNEFLKSFRFYRKKKGSVWVKTAHRGWITFNTYEYYKGYGFDPIILRVEYNGKITWSYT
jgi:hypothetical protein